MQPVVYWRTWPNDFTFSDCESLDASIFLESIRSSRRADALETPLAAIQGFMAAYGSVGPKAYEMGGKTNEKVRFTVIKSFHSLLVLVRGCRFAARWIERERCLEVDVGELVDVIRLLALPGHSQLAANAPLAVSGQAHRHGETGSDGRQQCSQEAALFDNGMLRQLAALCEI
jgi:hypothetical protein